jgi:hypothetical protein
MEERSIGATALTGHEHPPRAFPRGRVCKEPGCSTVLSVYHEGDYCYRHERPEAPRLRGKKIA